MKSVPLMERLLKYLVKHQSGCWTLGDKGGKRAKLQYRGKGYSARTLLWEQYHGKVPEGRQLRADCRDKRCINPAHCRVAAGTLEQRLKTWSREKLSGCIEWFGCRNEEGYGMIRFLGKNYPAHRVAYELYVGGIPKGLFVCHRCDNPSCVNVLHLFLGTAQDNASDMVEKGRSFCGETHHSAKLNPDKVLEIRKLFREGTSVSSIARKFGVSFSAAQKVVDEVTWKQVYGSTK